MDTQNPKKQGTKHGLRVLLVLLCAAALLAAGYFLIRLLGGGGISQKQQAALEAALEKEELQLQDSFRVTVSADDLSVSEGLDPDWMNILLLGTDSWGALNQGRSDALLVLSVHQTSGKLKLTSLIRDMLVPIPGASPEDKLTHANAYGGPLLAVKTVNELLKLNISHYCSANFDGFIQAVDTLGGVELMLSEGEARQVRVDPSAQALRLNGTQALDYVRIRKLDNNFGRNERQRKFMAAMLAQARGQDTSLLMDAFTQALQATSTNLSAADVLRLLQLVLGSKEDMATLSLPAEGQYGYGTAKNGTSGVTFNQEKLQTAFHDFLYERSASSD